ncbi:MAG TPA: OmpA family protein [Burkholderiaceae bacterium]|jgi:outer membrane protein OmpA-like peptidoglycan-associated protein
MRGAGLVAACLLAGCSTAERVILLPQADGRPSAVIVQRLDQQGAAPVMLSEPYAEAVVRDSGTQLKYSDPEGVRSYYSRLMQEQPPRPRRFTINFLSNSNKLTPASAPVISEVIRALTEAPAGELVVIGHTDLVGSMEANDKLSLERARLVAAQLEQIGVPRERITVVGRGKREPLVPTANGVDEPRNRRVEIKLR